MGKESKTTKTTEVPEYVTAIGQSLAGKAGEVLSKPFEAYTGQRVADFTSDQQSAFQKLRDLISGAPQVGADAIKGAQNYAKAGPQQISTERVVDQNGRLGAIDDYLNPQREAVLNPALRVIQEQADAQRKKINANRTTAGAFGDARHGISEAMLGRDTSLAMGETAGKIEADAYDKAMGQRAADLARMLGVDTQNANFNEQALGRELTGTGAMLDRATADQARQLTGINALLGSGTQQQGNAQQNLDAAFQEFMRRYGDDYTKIAGVSQALQGLKGNYGTTTTETKPDNSLLGGVGSAVGSALGSNGFWNWLGGSGAASTIPGTLANGGWATTVLPAAFSI